MKHLFTFLVLLLIAVRLAAAQVPSPVVGVQPVVVLAGVRAGHLPLASMTEVRAAATSVAALFARESGGLYTLDLVTVAGPFTVPAATPCNALYGEALEAEALRAGVVFPPAFKPMYVWDCGHSQIQYTSTQPGAVRGIITDNKIITWTYGLTIGLYSALAEVIPRTGTNAFDGTTPMGQVAGIGSGSLQWWERWLKGWVDPALRIAEIPGRFVPATKFVSSAEWPNTTGAPKLWQLSNGIRIEAHQSGRSPAVVRLHRSASVILDLNRTDYDPGPGVSGCRQYDLPVGQIFTLGDGIGIRVESAPADGSGATVSTFAYTGPITVSCTVKMETGFGAGTK